MNSFCSLYSNYPHYSNEWRDRFGRDRFFSSGNGNIFEPVLSREIAQKGFLPHYPGGKKFAVCISHDIDHLYVPKSPARKLVNVVKPLVRGKLKGVAAGLHALGKDTIHQDYNLENMLRINSSFGFKSSYYFLSLQPGDEDYNYDLNQIAEQLKLVADDRNEIGLHGGHQAYNNFDKLISEKKRLESALGHSVTGYRNHYLRFEAPLSWRNFKTAGLEYDTTYGYPDCAGYKNGMCYPHYPYDAAKGEFIDIVEVPLLVMDATLFFYMRYDEAKSLELCSKFIADVAQCGGVFTLLWHNNFVTGEMGETYKKILQLLTRFDPWFATTLDLVQWWKNEGLLDRSHEIVKDLINN